MQYLETKPLLIIAGPTASGKSALTVKVCLALRAKGITTEILCADSITVYKDFNIGAAKPSEEEQKLVPHHLLNLRTGEENFTAGDFVQTAEPIIQSLHAKNILPVLVGGTGFYIRALVQGMTDEPEHLAERSAEIKEQLEERVAKEGIETLYQEMLTLDPILKEKIHNNDHYRVVRALQAMLTTGTRWSTLNETAKQSPPKYGNSKYFCLDIPRETLRTRVEARTKNMLASGLLQEVQQLLKQGISPQAKPLLSVGYKECVQQLLSPGEMKESLELSIVRETMRLAKRQRTFFRGEKNIAWLSGINEEENLAEIIAGLPNLG